MTTLKSFGVVLVIFQFNLILSFKWLALLLFINNFIKFTGWCF
jgi:hypothetical protein